LRPARAVELLEKLQQEALQRKREGGKAAGRGRPKQDVEPVPPPIPQTTGKARDELGDLLGVSGRSIDFARKVVKNGTPELIQAVDEGLIEVRPAAELAAEAPTRRQR
jgi:hypothetical protein